MKKIIYAILVFSLWSLVLGLILVAGPKGCAVPAEGVTEKFGKVSSGKQYIRLAGADRYATAVEVSKYGWPNGAKDIIITRGDNFPDGLAGAALAGKHYAPILLTWPSELPEVTKEEIKRLHPKEAYILGCGQAISNNVEGQVNNLGVKTYIVPPSFIMSMSTSSFDRYDTAEEIARFTSSEKEEGYFEPLISEIAFAANGENFPDALCASSWSAYKGYPILYVNKNDTYYVRRYTEEITKTLYILGGSDVVPFDKPENYHLAPGGETIRLAGEDRYETSKAIAENSPLPKEGVIISTGENFPDGLVAGPFHKIKTNAQGNKYHVFYRILLVKKDSVPEPIKQYLNKNKSWLKEVYIMGETDVVSEKVVNEIKSIVGQ